MKKMVRNFLIVIMVLMSMPFTASAAIDANLSISGETAVYKPLAGKTAFLKYTLTKLDTSEVVTDATWTLVTGNEEDIFVYSAQEGIFGLKGNSKTTDSSFKIRATRTDGTYAEKSVTIGGKPLYYDFESDTVGNVPAGYGTLYQYSGWVTGGAYTAKVASETANQYLAATSAAFSGFQAPPAMLTSSLVTTMEGKFRRNASTENGTAFVITDNKSSWIVVFGLNASNVSGKYCLTTTTNATSRSTGTVYHYAKSINYGEWANFKITLDFAKQVYSIWIDGTLLADQYLFNVNNIANGGGKLSIVRPYCNLDNFQMYSGYTQSVDITAGSSKYALIPPAGTTSTSTLSASMTGTGQVSATWRLPNSPVSGVSIDTATGLMSITGNAVAGPVSVVASIPNVGEYTEVIQLVKQYNDFEGANATQGWTGSPVIATDGTNHYITSASGTYARYNFPSYISGNVVIEAKIAKSVLETRVGEIGVAAIGASNWVVQQQINRNDNGYYFVSASTNVRRLPYVYFMNETKWVNYKLVLDTGKGLYATYINGQLLGEGFYPMQVVGETAFTINQFIINCEVDDLHIYNTSNDAPKALQPVVFNAAVNSTAIAQYQYFDVNNAQESCSVIEWEISDNANGPYSVIAGAIGNNYMPLSEQLGKYLRFSVTPCNAKAVGEKVYSKASIITNISIGEATINVNNTPITDHYGALQCTGVNTIDVSVPVKNGSDNPKSIAVAVVYYKSGQLSKIDYQKVTLGNDERSTLTGTVTTEIISSANVLHNQMKVFIWDEDGLSPLCDTTILH